jgi:uncharacterized membrane protein
MIVTAMDITAPTPRDATMAQTLERNIARLTRREREEEEQAALSQRIAAVITQFTGSMKFVVIHLFLYGAWIVANLGVIPGLKPFDPSLVILAMAASVEAIFLSTFVLINQNHAAATAQRRADLDLHVSLLAEHELTKLAELVERIAAKLGVDANEDRGFAEITKMVEPTQVLDQIDARRRAEGLEE